jgi:5-methylcytosine-specific restriction protein A
LRLSGRQDIESVAIQDIESLKAEECQNWEEGGPKFRYVSFYERRPRLRAEAIRHHHTVCQVCGFDFERFYGERGAGFIEVHHLKPVSTLKKKTSVDPKVDMAVICANCHRMIHRKRDAILSLNELRSMIKKRRGKRF